MNVMTASREIKAGFCVLLILIFASYLIITFTADSHHRAVVAIPEDAPDNGVVRVFYREPVLWRIAELISLASLVFFVFRYYSRKRYGISQNSGGMEQIS